MATEKRLIDANALMKAIKSFRWFGVPNTLKLMFDYLKIIIRDQPTVDAVEVVHGEWCEDYETFIDDSGKESYPIQTGYVCSECGKDGYPNWHYCPNCGAKNGRLV